MRPTLEPKRTLIGPWTPLGSGLTRNVFVHPSDPDLVVKFAAHASGTKDNLGESAFWHKADADLERHLTPVYDVADDGSWLVMARAIPFSQMNLLALKVVELQLESGDNPPMLPQMIQWDTHSSNLGVFEGRPVIFDYAPDMEDGDDFTSAYATELVDTSEKFLRSCRSALTLCY